MKIRSTELMEANLKYLSTVFKKDFFNEPTVGKKRIMDILTECIYMMNNSDSEYYVSNIAVNEDNNNELVYIYISSKRDLFTYRIYNGIINKKGKIEPIFDDLHTDKIKDEELNSTINTFANLLFFLFRTSYIKNSPYIHGLTEFDEPTDSNNVYDYIPEYKNAKEDNKIAESILKK